jgi:hypothetical protein
LREESSRYEAQLLAQEARVDHLELAYRSAAEKYAEAASLVAFDAESRKNWLFALQISEIYAALNEADLFVAIGIQLGLPRGRICV